MIEKVKWMSQRCTYCPDNTTPTWSNILTQYGKENEKWM